jgi:hypothetical protein
VSDDFDSFKSDGDDGGEAPADGVHTAWLERTAILDTRNGTRIKCEWRTLDHAYYWNTWHGIRGAGKRFTKNMLAGMGVDLDAAHGWDDLGDALARQEGRKFRITLATNDRGYQDLTDAQPDDQAELPVDTAGLPPVETEDFVRGQDKVAAARPGGGLFDDDDIPF